MKVKLSKNMKLIAIIVLSLIIITYMFYNSVKEGLGKKKGKKGNKGKYERAVWKDKVTCMNELKKDQPKCKYKDKSSDKWIDCDPENDDHKGAIKQHNNLLDKWSKNWCSGMEDVNKIKNKYSPDTIDWMKGQYKNYRAEMKKQYDEDMPIYNVESGMSHTQSLVKFQGGHGRIYNMSLEFK